MTQTSARALDKFYTSPACARACVADFTSWTGIDLSQHTIIEPSAGAGAFLDALPPGVLAYDIIPEDERICTQDFLALERHEEAIVIGNPPFGRVSSLAVAFFNHAAGFASHIGFILPRTFEKASIQNRLDPWFHLVGQRVLDPQSFTLEGADYAVPCVFQVWERRAVARPRVGGKTSHPDFIFTTREQASFAIQRVGVRAGAVKTDLRTIAAASHYFIRPLADAQTVQSRMERIDASAVKARTAGNPSISKAELISLYESTTL